MTINSNRSKGREVRGRYQETASIKLISDHQLLSPGKYEGMLGNHRDHRLLRKCIMACPGKLDRDSKELTRIFKGRRLSHKGISIKFSAIRALFEETDRPPRHRTESINFGIPNHHRIPYRPSRVTDENTEMDVGIGFSKSTWLVPTIIHSYSRRERSPGNKLPDPIDEKTKMENPARSRGFGKEAQCK